MVAHTTHLHTDLRFLKWTNSDPELHTEGISAVLVWYLCVSRRELPQRFTQRCYIAATPEMRVSTLYIKPWGYRKAMARRKNICTVGSNRSKTNSNPRLLRNTAIIRTLTSTGIKHCLPTSRYKSLKRLSQQP